ncbi:MAG TPA: hypothetical protein VK901_01460 [Nitrospiraceae bacterium]|nr:hypothetical protein [Nitrospiraceae bacterium]
MPSAVTSTKGNIPRSFGSTMFAKKSSRYEVSPRSIGQRLAQVLHKLGYSITRQTGSHLRLTTRAWCAAPDDPATYPTPYWNLSSVLADVGIHFEISRDTLLERLFS